MKKSQARKAKATVPEVAAPRLSDLAYDRILESLFERRVPVGAFISQSELSELSACQLRRFAMRCACWKPKAF